MSFLTQGYEDDPLAIIRSATFKEEYRQMVLVKDIEYTRSASTTCCLLRHGGHRYIPNGEVVGLSKMARTVEVFAKRFQLQERLTAQIADALWTS